MAVSCVVAVVGALMVGVGGASATDAGDSPGSRPPDGADSRLAAAASGTGGLQLMVNERGRISRSVDAGGSVSGPVDLVVTKPESATVRKAYLAYATTGFSRSRQTEPLSLEGEPVPITHELANGISSYNYFADVTGIVAPVVDGAAAGDVHLTVVEPDPWETEGEILVVVFDDPAVTSDQSVTVLYGGLSPLGDTYAVSLLDPIDLSDPDTTLEMSLGISFGWQGFGEQYSLVDVNGQRLTSAAGGYDDGVDSDGGLVTAGGVGDSTENPADAQALPTSDRDDDELYDLVPFVQDGDTEIRVSTSNPSLDDNVLLATFLMNPPVDGVVTGTGDFTLTPSEQSAPAGSTVVLTSPINPIPFLNTVHAEVTDGPNTGQPLTVTCGTTCLSLFEVTWYVSGTSAFREGTDTVLIWVDRDGDGMRGPDDPASSAQVTWTRAIHAVGMGDSYSSGEGVDPYDPGTDDDFGANRNQCHRSPSAYARVWQPPGYRGSIADYLVGQTDTQLDFIACAGATTNNVRHGGGPQFTEGSTQLDQNRATSDTDLVTLSIGGNDVGFAIILEACALSSCFDPDNEIGGVQAQDWAEQRLGELPGRLDRLLPQIAAAAGNATVVLLGYPQLFTEGSDCAALSLWDDDERAWLNESAVRLDGVMRDAASRAGVHYVSVLDAFQGHAVCGPEGEFINGPTAANPFDWFNGVAFGTGSFHPTAEGQAQYAETLRAGMLDALATSPANRAGLPVNPNPITRLAATAEPAAESTSTADLGRLGVLPVDGDADSTCLPDGLVHQGSRVRVAGEGFAPGVAVDLGWQIWAGDHRSTASLGTATADSAGRVAAEVQLPPAALDSHALVTATGAGPERPLELLKLVGVARSCSGEDPEYDFSGFYDPVDNAPTVNRMNAGRSVPVKFSLDGDHGLDVLAEGSPASHVVSCSSSDSVDEVETTTSTNAKDLTYDAVSDTYQYVWSTSKDWAGTCRAFDLTLSDGTTHTALFSFR